SNERGVRPDGGCPGNEADGAATLDGPRSRYAPFDSCSPACERAAVVTDVCGILHRADCRRAVLVDLALLRLVANRTVWRNSLGRIVARVGPGKADGRDGNGFRHAPDGPGALGAGDRRIGGVAQPDAGCRSSYGRLLPRRRRPYRIAFPDRSGNEGPACGGR